MWAALLKWLISTIPGGHDQLKLKFNLIMTHLAARKNNVYTYNFE